METETVNKSKNEVKEMIIDRVKLISDQFLSDTNIDDKGLSNNIDFKITNLHPDRDLSGGIRTLNHAISDAEYIEYKRMFHEKYYHLTHFKNVFKINKDDFNNILKDNSGKTYMHIFFINETVGLKNDLNLIFRFSDINQFSYGPADLNLNLEFATENAYLLNNGRFTKLHCGSKSISEYDLEFTKNIGAEISTVIDSNLTKYITDDMSNVALFKEFTEDFFLEIVCKLEHSKIRFNLVAYINNVNRQHHKCVISTTARSEFAGYYNQGNLRP